MNRPMLLAACAALASTMLIACGDDDDDNGEASPGVTTTPTIEVTATTTTPGATASPDITGTSVNDEEWVFDLEPLNGSGVSGTVTLTEGLVPESTGFIIMIDDTEGLGTVGLHAGTCDDFEEEPLNELGDFSEEETSGTATTDTGVTVELPATSIQELREGEYIVVVMDAEGNEPQTCGEVSSATQA